MALELARQRRTPRAPLTRTLSSSLRSSPLLTLSGPKILDMCFRGIRCKTMRQQRSTSQDCTLCTRGSAQIFLVCKSHIVSDPRCRQRGPRRRRKLCTPLLFREERVYPSGIARKTVNRLRCPQSNLVCMSCKRMILYARSFLSGKPRRSVCFQC